MADEAIESEELRVESLSEYENSLKRCLAGKYENEFWKALHNTIIEFNLTPKYFFDLLNAFKQDTVKKRYETFDELIDYCSSSANPVGRIILEFFDLRDEQSMLHSDSICTALQLTNFYQDISIDIEKGRIYVPLDEMEQFGVSEKQFSLRENSTNFEQLVAFQVNRTAKLFSEGKKLIPALPKELKRQIILTIIGGETILKKIRLINYRTILERPRLSKVDYIKIFLKSFVR